jgi:hypothetical protein
MVDYLIWNGSVPFSALILINNSDSMAWYVGASLEQFK